MYSIEAILESYISYLIIFFLMLFFACSKQSKISMFGLDLNTFLWCLVFAIAFGIRNDVGADYYNYYYEIVEFNNTGYIKRGFETSFKVILYVCRFFSTGHIGVFFIYSFIQILMVALSFKDEKKIFPFLSIALIISFDFLFWMNGIRQATSSSCILYSIYFLSKKNYYGFSLMLLAALFFHRMALLVFPFLAIMIIVPKTVSIKTLFLILFASSFLCINKIYFSNIPILEDFFTIFQEVSGEYTKRDYDAIIAYGTKENVNFGVRSYITLIWVSISILLYPKMKSQFGVLFQNLFTLFFIGYIFHLLLFDNHVFLRPFMFLYYFSTFILSYLLKYLFENRSNILYYYTFIFLLGLTLVDFIVFQMPNAEKSALYSTCFSH